jgi:hypothetical protein
VGFEVDDSDPEHHQGWSVSVTGIAEPVAVPVPAHGPVGCRSDGHGRDGTPAEVAVAGTRRTDVEPPCRAEACFAIGTQLISGRRNPLGSHRPLPAALLT